MSDTRSQRFTPPFLLRNPHIQNLASSTGPRHLFQQLLHRNTLVNTQTLTLDCGDGIRLQGDYNAQPERSKGLVILLHGWEGSSRSAYIVSAAATLFNAGFSIFRLNFRDHGNSHHLNKTLFNSSLLDEVINAIKVIQKQAPSQPCFLAGFSLGGNFALRVALKAKQYAIPIQHTAAICPVIKPANVIKALSQGLRAYENYFVKKWKHSLLTKARLHPEYDYGDELKACHTLLQMHEYFVPRYTEFTTVDEYFNAYCLAYDTLADLERPATIITSMDDPIVKPIDLMSITKPDSLTVEITDYGSHCAFLADYRMNSWADYRLKQIFTDNP